MVRSKIKLILISAFSLIFISFLTLFGLFVYYVPDVPVSLAVFEISYKIFPFKKSFLEFYSPANRNFGVNIRTNTANNVFLLQRLETTKDENEIAAIAHYYALQSEKREYDIFRNVSEKVKPLIIEQLIKELNDNNSKLSDKIMLLETTRTGKRIGKGAIGVNGVDTPTLSKPINTEEGEKLFNEWLDAASIKQKYQQWWNSSLSWEEKKKINPLEGTGIKVSECCG